MRATPSPSTTGSAVHLRFASLACGLAGILAASRAAAQTAGADPAAIQVRVDRARAERERVEAESRFATSIDARERGTRVTNVADLMDEAPGVHARRTGDALHPTTIAFRGAPTAHVTVAIDGVVLNDASGGGIDVSLIAPSILERVDVYRGVAPARLGNGGLAGAVEFVTRAPTRIPRVSLSLGMGSFLERRATAAVTAALGPVDVLGSLAYRGTRGDFTFYDDNSTPDITRDDDPNATRVNNAGDAVSGLARACTNRWRSRTCALLLVDWRSRGMPGNGNAQLTSPSLEQWRVLGRVSHRVPLSIGVIEPFVSFSAHDDHFRDPLGQTFSGTPVDSSTAGTSTTWGWITSVARRDVRVEANTSQRIETYSTAALGAGTLDAHRSALLAAADVRVDRGALQVTGSFAAEVIHDSDSRGFAAVDRFMPSPRLGARVLLPAGFELRANVAHLERSPSLVDLYGIGGYLESNTGLRAERSNGGDLGAVFRGRSGAWSTRVELVGFGRQAHNLIALERSGPVAYKAFNLDDVRIAGLESQVRLSFREHFDFVASYAFTDAVTIARDSANGRHPPGIPAHDFYARAQGTLGPFSAWIDVSFVSGIYLDRANTFAAPPRALLGAGALARVPWVRGLALSLTASNLLDQRDGLVTIGSGLGSERRVPIEDFTGYPLPGRSVFATVHYSFEPSP